LATQGGGTPDKEKEGIQESKGLKSEVLIAYRRGTKKTQGAENGNWSHWAQFHSGKKGETPCPPRITKSKNDLSAMRTLLDMGD